MKLTKKQLSTMALIKRSCQHPDGTYSVSKTVRPLIDDMPVALIERDFQPGSGGRIWLTAAAEVLMEWVI